MKESLQRFGYILFLSGTVLLGLMHVAIALFIPNLRGWSDPPGKLATVLTEIIGWGPYVLSIIFISIGALILLFDLWIIIQKEKG
ncbi:hypothetical protein [Halalkalibacter urbisdiaboli]|uniref:hypothetical protein n=1 Tax=Halalkalibacter urbisdiaboli TaxID=1960589 RepID=UPI000B4327D8|nr:hypothetical protein [Halalkalibacter urbisdiaboli]